MRMIMTMTTAKTLLNDDLPNVVHTTKNEVDQRVTYLTYEVCILISGGLSTWTVCHQLGYPSNFC